MAEVLIGQYQIIYCGICSLQQVLSGPIVTTTNQRWAWCMETPSYDVYQWSFA